MKALASWLFETSIYSPFWTAWAVGFVVVGADGGIYLTEAGAEFLGSCEERGYEIH